jgi:uncharacterized protein (UPF0248 family)
LNNDYKKLLAQTIALDAGIALVSRSDSRAEHCLGAFRRTAMYRHLLEYLLTTFDEGHDSVYFEEVELFAIREAVSRVLAQVTSARQTNGFHHRVTIGAERLQDVVDIPQDRKTLSGGFETQIAAMALTFVVGNKCFAASEFGKGGGIEETCAALFDASKLYGVVEKLDRNHRPEDRVNLSPEQFEEIRDAARFMKNYTHVKTPYHRALSIDLKGLKSAEKLLLK